MDLSKLITSAEKKYKMWLEEFFTEVFSNTNLFSHAIDHHRRVWSFGKEMLNQIIVSFFNEYNKQCNDYQFDTSTPSGFCGVAEILQYMMRQHLTPSGLYTYVEKNSNDRLLNWFFSELKNELSSL